MNKPLEPRIDSPQRMQGSVRLDTERMREDFAELSRIGATGDGGVSRPTFSDAHLAARKWFDDRATQAGLLVSVDSAGNHSAILRRRRQGPSPVLLLGSHLDSVPSGGRFDGAMGVLCSLEVVIAFKEAGADLPFTLEAIDFTDEEGTLMGLLGSQALAGTLTAEALQSPRGGRDALLSGLSRGGLDEKHLVAARRDPSSLLGYLELHIEQGPYLERQHIDIGVGTRIVGSRSFRIVLQGEGGHAGTTPMEARHDAGVAASRIVLKAREIVVRDFPGSVITVGDIRLEPGAFNVIPKTAQLALEFRSQDEEALLAIEAAVRTAIESEAKAEGVSAAITPVARWQPVQLDARLSDVIERVAHRLGLSTTRLASGAGHDAEELATVTPTGMIFVPSVAGISHDPREFTAWEDVVNGAKVLLGTVEELAQQP